MNLPDAIKIGTVGRPLGGTTVRVAEDGELQVRGGQVFSGYWRNDEATADVLTADGWLATGDLGEIDDEGFVRVTGPQGELLVTAGGKNVAPTLLEDGVRAHPLVSQCLVVGDGRPFIAALVTLDPEAVAGWRRRLTAAAVGCADLAADEDLRAEVQAGVDAANRAVSQAESIRRFTVLPMDWTEEGGQLTPSLSCAATWSPTSSAARSRTSTPTDRPPTEPALGLSLSRTPGAFVRFVLTISVIRETRGRHLRNSLLVGL